MSTEDLSNSGNHTATAVAMRAPAFCNQENSQIAQLANLISQLTMEVSNLKKQINNNPSSRPSTPNRQHQRSRSRSTSNFCYYHRRFRDKAIKCEKTCSYMASNNNGEH
ncbi:hypothetical protein Pcinc_002518 [Petrolisthes cinctipes]|uniref:Uncharacterized protein n=1 Tax=Petrolisthes cinctipes TaxID=88211 RepID=A0AAE1GQ54_PETCI|nr:hypothetical protein Pcinc_002518 [Petrolisthes cinctipes]